MTHWPGSDDFPGEDDRHPFPEPSVPELRHSPSSDFIPTRDLRSLDERPKAIAALAVETLRQLFGQHYDFAPAVLGFQSSEAPNLLQWFVAHDLGDAQQQIETILSSTTEVVDFAGRRHRRLVCLMSLSACLSEGKRALTKREESATQTARSFAASLADHLREAFGDTVLPRGDAELDSLVRYAAEDLGSRCLFLSDVAPQGQEDLPFIRAQGSGQRWFLLTPEGAVALVRVLLPGILQLGTDCLVALTSVPHQCEFWRMGDRTQAQRLHDAIDRALAAVQMPNVEEPLAEVSGPVNSAVSRTDQGPASDALDAEVSASLEAVSLPRTVWQSLRAEMKDVIEARVRELSQMKLETYEQKRNVEAELRSVMDAWGFRAVAPRSGKPAYLRCRVQERNPYGQFYFSDVPRSEVVQPPDPEGVVASAQVPLFSLTDALTDSRPSRTS